MKIEGPLIKGRFLERPNRFITLVEVNGRTVKSHLPDPGRLKELLVPGAELLLRPRPKGSNRKTEYSTVMVRHEGILISLVSALPNRFVKESLLKGALPMFNRYGYLRSEVQWENHRFDFLLENEKKEPFYLEVKSVTFVENGLARFPDAVTERGARHAETLGTMVRAGGKAGILFVCQRPDARLFRPMWDRDPRFGHALWQANQDGVSVWCVTTEVSETEMTFSKEIPVNLEPNKIL